MQAAREYTLQCRALYGVGFSALMLIMGAAAVHYPMIAVGGSLLALAGIVALVSIRDTNIFAAALWGCGLLIAFPAFLPRPAGGRVAPAIGGGLDDRALIQLVIFSAVFVLACWLWLQSDTGVSHVLRPPSLALTLYGYIMLFSLVYTPGLAWSAYSVFKFITVLCLIVVLSSTARTYTDIKRLVDVLILAVTVVFVVFWIDILTGSSVASAGGRTSTTWIHPNEATLLAVTVLTISMARFLVEPLSSGSFKTIGVAALSALTAFTTASKSSLGAAAISLVILIIVILLKRPSGSVGGRLGVMAIGLSAVFYRFQSSDTGIVAHLQSYGSNENIDPTSLSGRIPIWETAITSTLSNPFTALFGHGYLSTFQDGLDGGSWTAFQAHNSFVQTFFDLGIIGLSLVVFVYFHVWLQAIRSVRHYETKDPRWTRAVELLCVLTVFTVVSFTEDILGGTIQNTIIIFFLIVFSIHQNAIVTIREVSHRQRA